MPTTTTPYNTTIPTTTTPYNTTIPTTTTPYNTTMTTTTTPYITTIPTTIPTTPTGFKSINLSRFFPPVVNECPIPQLLLEYIPISYNNYLNIAYWGMQIDFQTTSLIYYVGSYYNELIKLSVMDNTGNIDLNKLNGIDQNTLINDWKDKKNILNPVYNYINDNINTPNFFNGNVCNTPAWIQPAILSDSFKWVDNNKIITTINTQFSNIITNTGTYSVDSYPIFFENINVPEEGISKYPPTIDCTNPVDKNIQPLPTTNKIQPFLRQKQTVLYDAINSNTGSMDLQSIKDYLNKGIPLLYCVAVEDNNYNRNNPNTFYGHFHYQSNREKIINTELRGQEYFRIEPNYHIVTIVGYQDSTSDGTQGYFILLNSWGEEWGDKGYAKIDYTFFLSSRGPNPTWNTLYNNGVKKRKPDLDTPFTKGITTFVMAFQ